MLEHLADVAPEPEPSDIAITFGLLGLLCVLFVGTIVFVVVLVLKRRQQ